MKIYLKIITILVTFFACIAVHAADTEKAKKAFSDGTAYFQTGSYFEAAEAFRTAYNHSPNWKLLYNVGQCEAEAGRHGLALEAFTLYLREGGDHVPDERRLEVESEIERLNAMVGIVNVVAPDGLLITVDGLERGQTPLDVGLPVSSGVEHVVKAIDGDQVLQETVITIAAQETTLFEVKEEQALVSEPHVETANEPALSVVEPSDESKPSGIKIGGWVTLGTGAAALIGAGVTGGMALSLDRDLVDACENGCPDRKDDLDKRDSLRITSAVLLGVGAAATTAGVLMLTVFSKKKKTEEDSGEVAINPILGPNMAGAVVNWRF